MPIKGFLATHAEAYSDPKIVSATGPVIQSVAPLLSASDIGEKKYKAILSGKNKLSNAGFNYYTQWAPACNISFRKDFFMKIGGFDDIFCGSVPNSADVEICHRTRKA